MGMELQDRKMTCTVCGAEYIFTKDEQQFFIRKALDEPRRCKKCRRKKRKEFAKRRKKLMQSLSRAEAVNVVISPPPVTAPATVPINQEKKKPKKVAQKSEFATEIKSEEKVQMGIVPNGKQKGGVNGS